MSIRLGIHGGTTDSTRARDYWCSFSQNVRIHLITCKLMAFMAIAA
jgi:hypothetical protein